MCKNINNICYFILIFMAMFFSYLHAEDAKDKAKAMGMDHTSLYSYVDTGIGYMDDEDGNSVGLNLKLSYAFNEDLGVEVEVPLMYQLSNHSDMMMNDKSFMVDGFRVTGGSTFFRNDNTFGALYGAVTVETPGSDDNFYKIRPMLIGAIYFDTFMIHPIVKFTENIDKNENTHNSYMELNSVFMFFDGDKITYGIAPKLFINVNSGGIEDRHMVAGLYGTFNYQFNKTISLMNEFKFTQDNNFDIPKIDFMIGLRYSLDSGGGHDMSKMDNNGHDMSKMSDMTE